MNIFKINSLLLLLFTLFLSGLIYSQKYNFRNFSMKEGIADAITTSIVQSDEGYLYIGTQNGLSKFDGKNSVNYNTKDGLPSNIILNIAPYQQTKLLLATLRGLSVFDGEYFNNFSRADGLTSDTLNTIFKDGDRYLIGTRNGITIFSNNSFLDNSEFNYFKGKDIYSFKRDNKGTLYVGTYQGLFKVEKENIITIIKENFVFDLELSSDGTLWCGTDKGAYTYKNDTLEIIKNLENFEIYSIKEDFKKQIWFGTNNGIMKKNYSSFIVYPTTEELNGRECYSIFEDKELNLWFATDHGINLFDDGLFTLYDRRDGVAAPVWNIKELSNGEIWAATDGDGVIRYENDNFYDISYLANLPKTIWSFYEDKNKNVWFCTDSGVTRLDSSKFLTHFSKRNGFTDDTILEICEDQNGVLWFLSEQSGVYKYDYKNFEKISLINAGNSQIYGGITGFDNNLWLISASGIDRIDGDKSLDFPNQALLNNYSFYSISADTENKILLLGSFERGLVIYSPETPENKNVLNYISTEDGLNDNAILFTKFDDDNSILWIGTNKGLNKLFYKKYIETGEIIIESYNEYDGFPSQECHQVGTFIDSKGNFWFSTVMGIIKYDKTKELPSDLSSPFISSIEINYNKINLADFGERNEKTLLKYEKIEFPYFMNNITIYFSSLYYRNPHYVQFSYRLLGSNKAFSPLTKNQYVTFSSLPPGKYIFELISYTKNGTEASAPIQFSFYVQTPFWRSIYFYLLILFLTGLLIYSFYRIKTSAIRKKNLELLKLYKENVSYQKQLIESENDYRGLFENAHNAILVIDPLTFLIMDANNSAESLYGYERKELINMSAKVLAVDINTTINLLEEVNKNQNIKNYRASHLKKDGSELQLSINANFANFKGKTALISVHRDITHEEETKTQLLLAKTAAEKSNKLKSAFLAQISHEIRTPLNTILSYVSLIEEEFRELNPENANNYFYPLRRSSSRIIRTIDLILNMSEVNAGTIELSFNKIDISKLLDEIVDEQIQNAKENNLKLEFINNATNSNLLIDKYTFEQIFINLIDNAIKYTNEGNIDVILSNEDSKMIIEVRDTGIGIAEIFIPSLFESFTQEEEGYTRKYDGNGLGLALVKNYTDINKGKISVKSKKGIGTTFRVEF